MTDVHTLSGAYVLDAVDDLERARFERHLADCTECQAEVASLRETAVAISSLSVVQPPASLRSSVLDEIRTVRPLPPLVASQATQASPPRRRLRVAIAAAAAAVVAVLGISVWQPWDDSARRAPVAMSDRVMAASDAQKITLKVKGGGTATAVNSRQLGRAVVITKDMPPLTSGTVYELWFQDKAGNMTSAGLMSTDGTKLLAGDSSRAHGIGITVEKSGGSKEPTSAPVALFDFATA